MKTADRIILVTAQYFDIAPKLMKAARRDAPVAHARQVAMYLCRELAGMSYPAIGLVFCRDHSTVQHGYRRIERLRLERPPVDVDIQAIGHLLAASPNPVLRAQDTGPCAGDR